MRASAMSHLDPLMLAGLLGQQELQAVAGLLEGARGGASALGWNRPPPYPTTQLAALGRSQSSCSPLPPVVSICNLVCHCPLNGFVSLLNIAQIGGSGLPHIVGSVDSATLVVPHFSHRLHQVVDRGLQRRASGTGHARHDRGAKVGFPIHATLALPPSGSQSDASIHKLCVYTAQMKHMLSCPGMAPAAADPGVHPNPFSPHARALTILPQTLGAHHQASARASASPTNAFGCAASGQHSARPHPLCPPLQASAHPSASPSSAFASMASAQQGSGVSSRGASASHELQGGLQTRSSSVPPAGRRGEAALMSRSRRSSSYLPGGDLLGEHGNSLAAARTGMDNRGTGIDKRSTLARHFSVRGGDSISHTPLLRIGPTPIFMPVRGARLPDAVASSLPLTRLPPLISANGGRFRKALTVL